MEDMMKMYASMGMDMGGAFPNGASRRAAKVPAAARVILCVRSVAELQWMWVSVGFMVVATCLSGGTDVYFHVIWMVRIRSCLRVRYGLSYAGAGFTPPLRAEECGDGRSRCAVLAFPIVADLYGFCKEQCLASEAGCGNWRERTNGSAPAPL